VYGGKSLSDPSLVEGGSDSYRCRNVSSFALPFCGGLNDPLDFPPAKLGGTGRKDPPVDLVISTPATIGPLGLKPY
jgi:hypothetical protein